MVALGGAATRKIHRLATPAMASSLAVALVPLAMVVVAIVLVALSGRGKKLKCPDCGTVFGAPMMDNKRSGMGWTLPHMGAVKCPKCGESRPRRDYQRIEANPPTAT